MRGLWRLFTILIVFASFCVAVSAQDERSEMGSGSLAALLRFVPDNDEARRSITFADYRAAEAARLLDTVPQSFADFETMDRDARSLWIASTPTGGVELSYFTTFNTMPQAMGIDFFQIDRSLVWGIPPDRGFVLQGDFDEEAIRTAHEARGFVESELDGAPLWCSADGCDTGFQTDLRDRQPADLFGGDLGRKFPRALTGNFFLSAGLDTSLEQMTDAGIGGERSLTDDPAYQAVVAALDGDRHIRAVQFIPTSDFLDFDISRIAPGMSEEQIRELIDRLRGGAENLPVYNLAMIADIADAEKEYGVIGLVYRSEEAANMAAEILIDRINAAESAAMARPWADIIAERGATLEAPSVFHATDAERYVTLITISKSLPPNGEDENGRYVQSGLLFRLFLDGYIRRDLGWLQPVLLN